MLKKFYHKLTKTILIQQDWVGSTEGGDFSLITSHHLANMGDDVYSIDIVANLEDCIDIHNLKETFDLIHEFSNIHRDEIWEILALKYGLDLQTTKELLKYY